MLSSSVWRGSALRGRRASLNCIIVRGNARRWQVRRARVFYEKRIFIEALLTSTLNTRWPRAVPGQLASVMREADVMTPISPKYSRRADITRRNRDSLASRIVQRQ